MIRYKAKKWWSLKEADDGQYVAYHEYEDLSNKWRKENDNLWDRIRQQREEITVLKDKVKNQKGAFEQYSLTVSRKFVIDAEYMQDMANKLLFYKTLALTFVVVSIIQLVHAYI